MCSIIITNAKSLTNPAEKLHIKNMGLKYAVAFAERGFDVTSVWYISGTHYIRTTKGDYKIFQDDVSKSVYKGLTKEILRIAYIKMVVDVKDFDLENIYYDSKYKRYDWADGKERKKCYTLARKDFEALTEEELGKFKKNYLTACMYDKYSVSDVTNVGLPSFTVRDIRNVTLYYASYPYHEIFIQDE
jgi:hypothetical protein